MAMNENTEERFKEPCKECGHMGIPLEQKCVIFGDENNPVMLNIGEHIAIGPHKFKIIVGGKLDNRGLEPIAELKRV